MLLTLQKCNRVRVGSSKSVSDRPKVVHFWRVRTTYLINTPLWCREIKFSQSLLRETNDDSGYYFLNRNRISRLCTKGIHLYSEDSRRLVTQVVAVNLYRSTFARRNW